MEVACGSCLGCRLDRSRMWAMRIVHESTLYEYDKGNCFVTLTYDEDRMPVDRSLVPWHFTDFMKRLRHHKGGDKIRYFQAGEYGRRCRHGFDLDVIKCPGGCRHGRPHHHACLFNVSFDDLVSYKSDSGVLRYTSSALADIWSHGFVDVGTLNFESAAYVARYCLKKVDGPKALEHYLTVLEDGTMVYLEPEYATMSRGYTCPEHKGVPYQPDCPKCSRGIGADWYERYSEDVFPHDSVPIPGVGVLRKVPRFYEERFKESDPDMLDRVKDIRKAFRKAHAEEYTPERLHDKYRVKKAQVAMLKRSVS